jgi:peptidoglycan/xylan/chitin deacetylase (PgdA/CDA1 family)
VLPLPEAAERLRNGTLPERAACITFDDGYRNNHDVAAPLLAESGLPATFFIATGAIEAGAMWNDLLIEVVRHSDGTLDLSDFGLGTYRSDEIASRGRLVPNVLEALKYRPLEERAGLARAIYRARVGATLPSLMMSPGMIQDLARRGHDVGAHTVNHPILTTLADEVAEREIGDSARWIARVAGRAPRSFAYPNGRPGVDFTNEHCELVCRAGFTCAVSTEWACATPSSNAFALPRFTPWETTSRGFVTRLAKTYLRSYVARPGAL